MATATLGGGCFWCLEAVYQRLNGVNQVTSGYAGGQTDNPDYRSVTTGRTGHAEVVRIDYDPSVIDFETLLNVFFTIHDPTTADRQGADIGPQYRSIILWEDEDQLATANAVIERLTREGAYTDPIVTQVQPLEAFYPGEDYHQDYYRHNASAPYCQMVIMPKLEKAEARFGDRLRR
ncbi:peptide-methionine (S)-S-oxide reductase MsrA [Spiribacter salinus]|jgi:peptide-methionine (S)-S-oxide reductase|uniref:Peptide methionine sulfoxide reductase MsrA n=1 Tax=Spiribacter salinus TaxID=1335746 RepID=A0A540VR87_9GAMM|nr:peptide-methionine (S)-S-oxide reductase MsrA [Spiribacter salinus]MBY5269382.1 peptide-methionine (S)-S-oxide reductase [Spiribacter salinus]MDR9413334.1 peptide-methionine (S)-S-oxide reductase MsrA [Spiribacter sp.]MDR9454411.1 peptide-methionine (S)-S-oxide reductase MsrA [Spiribacter sp.]TQE99272.1 MAG: peptide-methionine (S)-S-oxide reductase MsrA [Spiribacter salinus]